MLPLSENMFRSQRETATAFLALLTQKLGQSMFVPLHQGMDFQQTLPASSWSLRMAVTVKAKPCSPPHISLGELTHVIHLHWDPALRGGPARELPLLCSPMPQANTLCKDSPPFRKTFLQDKESHFSSEIADGGLPVLRIFFLPTGLF